MQLRVAEMLGIGTLRVNQYSVDERRRPRLNRKPLLKPELLSCLTETTKTFAEAGNSEGNRWTPFAQTCQNIRNVVAQNPGISLKELMEKIESHHYANDSAARSAIYQWACLGKIKGIELRREGRFVKFFSKET